MKFTILNGSPKGLKSITMKYVSVLKDKFGDHEFNIINISKQISGIDNNKDIFDKIISDVKNSDAVVWAFPLYVFLVPSQYKRFIELIFERGVQDAFKGKYTAILATSVKFFDNFAINYISGICEDLDMKFIDYYSADMYDLLLKERQVELIDFMDNFLHSIENKEETFKKMGRVEPLTFSYTPSLFQNGTVASEDKKILILTDRKTETPNLKNMVEKISSCFTVKPEIFDINNIGLSGGCMGCLKCGYSYECSYTGKDGYIEFYNTKYKTADIIIIAGSMVDRYLSSKWKQFFDRLFFYTHTPTINGKQIAFLVSGNLKQNTNLSMIFQAYCEWQQVNLSGIICDEIGDSEKIDTAIYQIARKLVYHSESSFSKPVTFFGVGGMKVLRDDMWGRLRFPFFADHKYYKKHGCYDYPQYNLKSRLTNSIILLLCRVPFIREKIYKYLNDMMLMPFNSVK